MIYRPLDNFHQVRAQVGKPPAIDPQGVDFGCQLRRHPPSPHLDLVEHGGVSSQQFCDLVGSDFHGF